MQIHCSPNFIGELSPRIFDIAQERLKEGFAAILTGLPPRVAGMGAAAQRGAFVAADAARAAKCGFGRAGLKPIGREVFRGGRPSGQAPA
jgi:hypothetical protein